MGLVTITLYSAKCDEPECGADLVSDAHDDYDFEFIDRLDDLIWDQDWQKVEGGGLTLYYCREHHPETGRPPLEIRDQTPPPPPLFDVANFGHELPPELPL